MLKQIKKISHKHYIQCLIALLLTGVMLWGTSSLWLSKSIIVVFNSQAQKDINYQVFYTEEKGQGLKEQNSVRKFIKSGNHQVVIELPTPQIVKFRLDIGRNSGKIIISDLRLKAQKTINMDYKHFNKNQIDSYKIKGNKLILFSSGKDPYIVYKKELNLSAKNQTDWFSLIIISVFAFLLSYKFMQYLSDLKSAKQHSTVDVVMLAVFFALLFVPMSNISDVRKSEQEKRMFAKKPQFTTYNVKNGIYGKRFEAWYNDHFFGRNVMMNLYNSIKYTIAPKSGNNNVLVGKDGWLFYKKDNGINNYANKNLLSETVLQNSLKYLTDVNNWCKKHNKEFYVFIAPDKSKIYGEYYRLIKKQHSDEYSVGHQMYDYIHKNSDVKIVYPYDDMLENKNKGYLYYKHDTHWTDLGAYLGYKALMKVMKEKAMKVDFKPITHKGDLYGMYPVATDDEIYLKNNKLPPRCREDKRDNSLVCHNKNGGKSVFVQRDSFMVSLYPFMADNFDNMYMFSKYDFSQKDLDFIEKNVDVVVIETIERGIMRFNKKFPQNLIKEN